MFNTFYVFIAVFLTTLSFQAAAQEGSVNYKEINRKIYSFKKKDLNVKVRKDDSLTYRYVYFKRKDDVHSLQVKRVSLDTIATNTYFFLNGKVAKMILARVGHRQTYKQSSYYFEKGQLIWKEEKNMSIDNFTPYFSEGQAHLKKAKGIIIAEIN